MERNKKVDSHYIFLKSAFEGEGAFMSNAEVLLWLTQQNDKVNVNINRVDFDDLDKWILGETNLRHDSGQFFSIEGIKIKTNWGAVHQWNQPIINQPEVGYLGF